MDKERRDQIAQKIEAEILRIGPIFFHLRHGSSLHAQLRQMFKKAAKMMEVPEEEFVECITFFFREDA